MGIIELIGLAISAVGVVKQQAAARRAAKAQKEARAIDSASQQVEDKLARRRAAREERIRRGRLIAMGENSGTEGGSGQVGALSSLSTNFGAAQAGQSTQAAAARGISAANQQYADAQSAFDQAGAFSDLLNQGLDLWGEAKKLKE